MAGNSGPQLLNQLSDLAHITHASLDAYQATGGTTHMLRAKTLVDIALSTLYDENIKVFLSEPPDHKSEGPLGLPDISMKENSIMVEALARLYWLTSENIYRDTAGQVLQYFTGGYAH